jgi:competence protein CoiA
MMTIAIDSQNFIATPSQVVRGLACNCRCVECGEPVVAKKGSKNIHHFAHVSNKDACKIRPESFIHRFAKQVIAMNKGLMLPPMPSEPWKALSAPQWHEFDSMLEEVWVYGIKPDILAHKGSQPTMIEIAYTHFADEAKKAAIAELDIPTIEIDLSNACIAPTEESLKELAALILNETSNKHWLYPVLPEAVACMARNEVSTIPMTRYTINSIWVDVRELPFGKLSVRSVYNPELSALFRCLGYRLGGYYKKSHKNWLFDLNTGDQLHSYLRQLEEGVISPLDIIHSAPTETRR